MRHALAAVLALTASACVPAPTPMAATEASEVLELFAAGAAGEDVCTANGRARLRGAVRAYSAELARAGQIWPALGGENEGGRLSGVEVAVMGALSAGFVEASDLSGPARALARQFRFAYWPSIDRPRLAARVACRELQAMQQTAQRFEAERERMLRMQARNEPGARARALAQLQSRRLETSLRELHALAGAVTAKVEAARGGRPA